MVLNVDHPDIKLGETLSDFKEFTQSFDPYNRGKHLFVYYYSAAHKIILITGLAMSNAQQIRTVHNSFSRQTLFELDNSKNNKDEDVFHFISYLPIANRLYELDGLKEGPIDLGEIDGASWLDKVRPIIEKRIQKYSEGEIHFNLMANIDQIKLHITTNNNLSLYNFRPLFRTVKCFVNENWINSSTLLKTRWKQMQFRAKLQI